MMDSYLTGPDSLSLQEMLDMDIKSEKDLDEIFGFDLHELPSINLDEDSLGAPGDNNVWLTSSNDGNSLLGGDTSNGVGSDMNSGETRMVCPNSVMPVTLIQVPYDRPLPKAVSIKPVATTAWPSRHYVTPSSPAPAADAIDMFKGEVYIKEEFTESGDEDEDEVDSYAPSTYKQFSPLPIRNKLKIEESVSRTTISNGLKRHIPIKHINNKRRVSHHSAGEDLNLLPSVYPKPAYSYSCLIAMALKNSPGGSLPVSEIYNFMCEHFPYFKTAPTGWKNSVRHNLSLNKCFEKIEKPATNGSQRKGCLWAMNPNKINKMDEEVQKWSKKDKSAIRKSMIYPDSLDLLERGQLSNSRSLKREPESDDDQWDGNVKIDEVTEEEEEEEEEEEDEEPEEEEEEDAEEMDPRWTHDRKLSRLTAEDILSGFPVYGDDYDSDVSLNDFDVEVADAIYNADAASASKVNVQVKVATSSPNRFQPLVSGAYTVNSNGSSASPKRFKTLGGTITGNYVYKPLGSSASIRRKSPMRHSLLSSLEADD